MNRCIIMCLVLVVFALNAAAVDSQNKVPQHYCVEGAVAQNVYSGSVTLDGKGEAMVALPPYFDALNTNPQYVLTAVGAAMPNLHVMQKIHDNRFWIAGGSPAGEVSWMVIAQRNDPAGVEDLKNRPVEQIKSELSTQQQ
jgi:hypothetical protein